MAHLIKAANTISPLCLSGIPAVTKSNYNKLLQQAIVHKKAPV